MKANLLVPLLGTLALSSASPTPSDSPPFSVMAVRSASPIHYLSMTASRLGIWLGGETASYCPTVVEHCPPGNETVFGAGGSAMKVLVPGGQRVYIDPDGALSYTQAHSAYIPPGSATGPFAQVPGDPWDHYVFTGWGASGFMACPTEDQWRVFAAVQNATVPSGNVKDCLGFSALALPWEGQGGFSFPAWQYT